MDTAQPRSAPSRGAVALIENSRGELLLHLRDDIPDIAWPGRWSALGGGCDPDESPRETIVRELDEEAGLAVDDLVELFEVPDPGGSSDVVTVFAATWNGDARELPLTEGVKLDWFHPDRLGSLSLPLFLREALRRYLGD
ncbi:NUDIX domain-containing protein [Nocardiopsis exhalans]|uniref:8-oxo-dGTP diphosphatase n=2 Tax=Nocardiopsis TaxID=2013 RepID=A0A840WBD0_9ACTN|nr:MULTISPECIES: NUDIX domain-containing protein [Nocardiopsis]MBB5494299.1 8-oxo-dGTP diphosphatase [Nocardiopsis metallicus]USY20620.1 NUDIX domain-containing protein [Nocardiopsis exhalans]